MKIYTTGYHGGPGSKPDRTLENLNALCERRGLFVADIRYVPWSRNPLFESPRLSRALGDRYLWIPSLGNKNYRGDLGDEVMISNYPVGIKPLLAYAHDTGLSPLLLCQCRDYDCCHREDVANRLLAEGLAESIEEISRRGE
jgi:uncharacterized protein (DUF488 family)